MIKEIILIIQQIIWVPSILLLTISAILLKVISSESIPTNIVVFFWEYPNTTNFILIGLAILIPCTFNPLYQKKIIKSNYTGKTGIQTKYNLKMIFYVFLVLLLGITNWHKANFLQSHPKESKPEYPGIKGATFQTNILSSIVKLRTGTSTNKIEAKLILVTESSSLEMVEDKHHSYRIFPSPEIISIMEKFELTPDSEIKYNDIQRMVKTLCVDCQKEEYIKKLFSDDDLNLMGWNLRDCDMLNELKNCAWRTRNKENNDLVWYWLFNYVGQWAPQLRFNISNPTDNSLIINAIIFDVNQFEPFGIYKGQSPDVYLDFQLTSATGKQIWKLDNRKDLAPIYVPAHNPLFSFDISLIPKINSIQGMWKGTISLATNQDTIEVANLELETYDFFYCYN